MTKKHFIDLADALKPYKDDVNLLHAVAMVCMKANSNFNADRWYDYIQGKCGPNGGKVK